MMELFIVSVLDFSVIVREFSTLGSTLFCPLRTLWKELNKIMHHVWSSVHSHPMCWLVRFDIPNLVVLDVRRRTVKWNRVPRSAVVKWRDKLCENQKRRREKFIFRLKGRPEKCQNNLEQYSQHEKLIKHSIGWEREQIVLQKDYLVLLTLILRSGKQVCEIKFAQGSNHETGGEHPVAGKFIRKKRLNRSERRNLEAHQSFFGCGTS